LARFWRKALGLADLMNARNRAIRVTGDVEFPKLILANRRDVASRDRKERSARQC
jgi:hypothetical protein